MDASSYRDLFCDLLPPGPAWTREKGTVMAGLSDAAGSFFAYVGKNVDNAALEMFPQSADATLRRWENDYGLPEKCVHGYHAEGATFVDRQSAVLAKIRSRFSPTAANFVSLAATLGYDVTITTTPPAVCGAVRCSDRLGGTTPANYYWIVSVSGDRLTYARAGSARCGEVLCRISRADELECLFKRLKPAHTVMHFSYAEDG